MAYKPSVSILLYAILFCFSVALASKLKGLGFFCFMHFSR